MLPKVNTDVMQDASEIVHYDEIGIPLYIREGILSRYPDMRALCHWHEDIEFIRIRSGQMYYYINGTRILLEKDDCLMVNARQMHYGYAVERSDCTFLCILIHPRLFTQNSALSQDYILPILGNRALEYLRLPAASPDAQSLCQLLDEVFRLKCTHPDAYQLEAASLLTIAWCRLLRTYPMLPADATAPASSDLDIQRDMVSYIYHHYSDPITLDEIAAAGKVCRSKCCQIFRRYLQQSPIDFLNHYRLEVSCNLLGSTTLPIATIASSCGFNHQSYYSKLFLRAYHHTPRQFRLNHTSNGS